MKNTPSISEFENLIQIIHPVKIVFEKLPHYHTLSPSQYNHFKSLEMPLACTLMKRSGKSWKEILRLLNIPSGLERKVLSTLSQSLHLLEKRIIKELKIGWQEKNFTATFLDEHHHLHSRTMRPDSCYIERLYLSNRRIFILDVKLSIHSSFGTIYRYLPIFENPEKYLSMAKQMTFFPQWIPPDYSRTEPLSLADSEGQMDMFLENNILYICYLLGQKVHDLAPLSGITSCIKKKRRSKIWEKESRKLPENMEVRFIPFHQLPGLYAEIAGILYGAEGEEKMKPIFEIAEIIEELALSSPPGAESHSHRIYGILKSGGELPLGELLEMVRRVR